MLTERNHKVIELKKLFSHLQCNKYCVHKIFYTLKKIYNEKCAFLNCAKISIYKKNKRKMSLTIRYAYS